MPLLAVDNLRTYYRTTRGQAKAVDGVSFGVEAGCSLGIAGESGCGKSTVALSLMRLVKGGEIVGGSVTLDGTALLEMPVREFNHDIRWQRISLVPQGAMGALDPVFRVGEQIVEAIAAHDKSSRSAMWARAEQLLQQVDIDPARARCYPHELSGGMCQRVMIAMALALGPQVVIADEPTTALDVVTQAQVLRLLRRLQRELNVSIVFISHDLSTLAQACDRIMIMYAGKTMEIGACEEVYRNPRHPYTRALLEAFPDIEVSRRPRALGGRPPDLLDPPRGCRFNPRCPDALAICGVDEPSMSEVSAGRQVACHLFGVGT
ncbi:MAG: ABC transporter ATP-binding protein [Thermoleophilia bacterium]